MFLESYYSNMKREPALKLAEMWIEVITWNMSQTWSCSLQNMHALLVKLPVTSSAEMNKVSNRKMGKW